MQSHTRGSGWQDLHHYDKRLKLRSRNSKIRVFCRFVILLWHYRLAFFFLMPGNQPYHDKCRVSRMRRFGNRGHDISQHRFESWPGRRKVCNGEVFPCNASSTRNAGISLRQARSGQLGHFTFFIPFIESSTSSRRDYRFGGFLALIDAFLANGHYRSYRVGGF